MLMFRLSQIIAALTTGGDAYLIDLRTKHRSRVELEEPYEEGDPPNASGLFSTIRFNPSGSLIFCGTSAGMILVFNSRTKSVSHNHCPLSRSIDPRRLLSLSADIEYPARALFADLSSRRPGID